MNKQINYIVEKYETIDKATELFVFSYIQETSASNCFKIFLLSKTKSWNRFIYLEILYKSFEASSEPAQDLIQHSAETNLMSSSKNMSVAFKVSVFAKHYDSGCILLYCFKTIMLSFNAKYLLIFCRELLHWIQYIANNCEPEKRWKNALTYSLRLLDIKALVTKNLYWPMQNQESREYLWPLIPNSKAHWSVYATDSSA